MKNYEGQVLSSLRRGIVVSPSLEQLKTLWDTAQPLTSILSTGLKGQHQRLFVSGTIPPAVVLGAIKLI